MWEPSEIQEKILLKLLTSEYIKYSEIKPKNTANDLFNYHLQFLLRKGLVTKKDNLYSLSTAGLKFLEETKPISRTQGFTQSFRLSVIYVVRSREDNVLNVVVQKRTRKPFLGTVGLPSGKVLKGELAEDAAERVCFKETGIKCKFQSVGLLRSIRYFDKELFSDGLWFICVSKDLYEKTSPNVSIHGENSWISVREAQKIEDTSITRSPFLIELLQELETKEPHEITVKNSEEICKLSSL